MNIYVVSVQPGRERDFTATAAKSLDPADATFLFPQRQLTIRKKGKRREILAPIFAGYVFTLTNQITRDLFIAIKRLPGFYRFLESNERIRALAGSDLELVSHFVRFGDVIGKSLVSFDARDRIQVQSGPLEGLEGRIVKVDRRKQRAKVKLDLYEDSFLVDFGFESLLPTSSQKRAENETRDE